MIPPVPETPLDLWIAKATPLLEFSEDGHGEAAALLVELREVVRTAQREAAERGFYEGARKAFDSAAWRTTPPDDTREQVIGALWRHSALKAEMEPPA